MYYSVQFSLIFHLNGLIKTSRHFNSHIDTCVVYISIRNFLYIKF